MNKEKRNNKNQNKDKKKRIQLILLVVLLVVLVILAGLTMYLMDNKEKEEENTLAYTELIHEINNQNVESIEMRTGSTTAKVKLKNEEEEKTTIIPNVESFMDLLQSKVEDGNEIKLDQKSKSILAQLPSIIISLLPTAIMLALFIMLFKMQGIGEKGKVYDDTERKTKVRFDDVAGLDEEKQEMLEIVDFLKRPEKFTKMGARVPKGVLLYGKPGTGKTLIAKAIAGEADVPFISISGSEFIEMFAGLRSFSC